jgi:hypothetical protein
MTIEQVCLVVVLNLLIGSFITRLRRLRTHRSASFILVAMILTGFAMIWRSLMV